MISQTAQRSRWWSVPLASLASLLVLSAHAADVPRPRLDAEATTRYVKLKRTIDTVPDAVVFPFINAGDVDLAIAVRNVDCSCVSASLDKTSLVPGAEGRLSLKLEPDSFTEDRVARALMTSTDPDQPKVLFKAVVDWVDPVSLSDGGVLNLGHLSVDEERNGRIELIQNFGSRPLELLGSEVTGDRTSASFTEGSVGEKRALFCRVNVRAAGPLGPFSDVIDVRTNLVESPRLELRVVGIVAGDVELAPWQVHLGCVPAGSKRTRVVRMQLGAGVSVEEISTDVEGLEIVRKPGPPQEQLQFIYLSERATGRISGVVVLRLNDGREMVLPVLGESAPAIRPGVIYSARQEHEVAEGQ